MTTSNDKGVKKGQMGPEELAAQIQRLAREGAFHEAEKLREELLAAHPLALSAIIASGETLEEEMARRIDQEHLSIWLDLYAGLSQEARNLLFHSTKSAVVHSGKLLVRQGKAIPRLLFIDSGRVTLFHSKGEDRLLIGQLSRGDLLGDETFFELSIPTFSAGAQSDVQLRYLDKSATVTWEERQPGLLRRLADFCRKRSRAPELLSQKQIEKRQVPRHKADGKVTAYVLAQKGTRSSESYRGELHDISPYGACFSIHTTRFEAVQALLGRSLDLVFELGAAGEDPVARGTVVKVGNLLHNDFSIHLHFHTPFTMQEISR